MMGGCEWVLEGEGLMRMSDVVCGLLLGRRCLEFGHSTSLFVSSFPFLWIFFLGCSSSLSA